MIALELIILMVEREKMQIIKGISALFGKWDNVISFLTGAIVMSGVQGTS